MKLVPLVGVCPSRQLVPFGSVMSMCAALSEHVYQLDLVANSPKDVNTYFSICSTDSDCMIH